MTKETETGTGTATVNPSQVETRAVSTVSWRLPIKEVRRQRDMVVDSIVLD